MLYNTAFFPAQHLVRKRWICKCTAEGALAGVSQVEQLKVGGALQYFIVL